MAKNRNCKVLGGMMNVPYSTFIILEVLGAFFVASNSNELVISKGKIPLANGRPRYVFHWAISILVGGRWIGMSCILVWNSFNLGTSDKRGVWDFWDRISWTQKSFRRNFAERNGTHTHTKLSVHTGCVRVERLYRIVYSRGQYVCNCMYIYIHAYIFTLRSWKGGSAVWRFERMSFSTAEWFQETNWRKAVVIFQGAGTVHPWKWMGRRRSFPFGFSAGLLVSGRAITNFNHIVTLSAHQWYFLELLVMHWSWSYSFNFVKYTMYPKFRG